MPIRAGERCARRSRACRDTALQAIIFDFDGVIADSERLHLRAYQDILAPEGITLSSEDYYAPLPRATTMSACSRRWAATSGVAMDDGAGRALDRPQGRALRGAGGGGRDAVSRRRRLHPRGRGGRADRDRLGRADPRDRGGARARRACAARSRSSSAPIRPSAASRIPTRIAPPSRGCGARRAATWRRGDRWPSRTRKWGLVSARGADLRCVAVTNTYAAAELRADAELVCRRACTRSPSTPWTRSVLTEDAVTKPLAEQIADAADRPGPDLAAPAFLVARIEYPHLDPGPVSRSARPDGRRGVPLRRQGSGTRRAARRARRCGQPLPVRRARLRRQPRAVRRSAQQLPQRGDGSAARASPSRWRSSTSRWRGAPASAPRASTSRATSWCACCRTCTRTTRTRA